jgi:hypothetical protein
MQQLSVSEPIAATAQTDRNRREQVPDTAPGRGRKAIAPHHGIGEEDIDSVSERGRDDHVRRQKWLDLIISPIHRTLL